jgi:rhodanese-related sulfurtransferase
MNKKTLALVATLVLAPALILPQAGGGDVESVSPGKAYEMLQAPGTFLVDVRSVAEYCLVGHPEIAYNVPITFWSEEEARFVANADFLEDLKARFKMEDTLLFICKGGGRSRKAAEMAKAAGFEKAINIGEGFEGEADEKGLRTKNGWKNSLPYTYTVEPRLAYKKSADTARAL